MIRYYLVILFLMTAYSCSQKARQGEATFIIQGALGIHSSVALGGLYFAGRSSAGEEFRYGYLQPGNEVQLTLNMGEWTFYAIAWDGLSPMTGNTKCNITTASLDQGNQTLDISLSAAACVDSRFASSGTDEVNGFIPEYLGPGFKKLELHPCFVLPAAGSQEQNANCRGMAPISVYPIYASHLHGENLSYKIRLSSRGLNNSNAPILMSECIAPANNEDLSVARLQTDLTLPIGGSAGIIPFEILAFNNVNCSELDAIYSFSTPIERNVANPSYRLPTSSSDAMTNTFFFTDNVIGRTPSILNHKIAVLDCIDFSHCFPGIPTPQESLFIPGYDQVFQTYERLISNAKDRAVYDMGSKAFVSFSSGTDVVIEAMQAGAGMNNTLRFEIEEDGSLVVPFETLYNNATEMVTIRVNHNSGYCTVPTYQNMVDCQGASEIWTPLPATNEDLKTNLNTLFSANSLDLVASTMNPAVALDLSFIELDTPSSLHSGVNPRPPRRIRSALSLVTDAVAGPGMLVLEEAGFTNCSEIPTSGEITRSLNIPQVSSIRVEFSPGQITAPIWLNGGNTFQKRLDFYFDNQLEKSLEIDCDASNAGWVRQVSSGSDYTDERVMFWNTTSNLAAKFELYEIPQKSWTI
jgi:hypothetical protein